MEDLKARLRGSTFGLGTEDPYKYFARGVSAGDCIEAADRIEALEALLGECRLQLEHLDARSPTGTTPAVIARIDALLQDKG